MSADNPRARATYVKLRDALRDSRSEAHAHKVDWDIADAMNAIWPEVSELLSELDRHHRDFARISELLDLERSYSAPFATMKEIRNIVG